MRDASSDKVRGIRVSGNRDSGIRAAKVPPHKPAVRTGDDDEISTMRLLRGVAMALLLLAVIGSVLYGLALVIPGGSAGASPVKPVAATRSVPNFTPMARPVPLPPITFLDDSGRRSDLNDFAGKVVLLNLWATWCPPCVKEMPSLDRLQARLGGKDFQVVALSVDRGARQVVEPFLARLGITHLPIFLDPESRSLRMLGVSGLPTSLVLDRDGTVLGKLEGDAEWDSPEALRLIQRFIGNGGTAPERRQGGVIRTGG